MNPADFIRKHITAALTAEGFAPSVVQGVAEALEHYRCMSQSTKKGVVLQIAFFRLGNVGSWADNHRRAESGKEKAGKRWWHFSRPVLTSLRICTQIYLAG
jgi:hypothetical protein